MTTAQFTDVTGVERRGPQSRRIPVIAFGQALSSFFILSYTLCILGYLLLPGLPVDHAALGIFLPGFTLLSWHTFFLGVIESFIWAGTSLWSLARSTISSSGGGHEYANPPRRSSRRARSRTPVTVVLVVAGRLGLYRLYRGLPAISSSPSTRRIFSRSCPGS
jgi:hypothetical protein